VLRQASLFTSANIEPLSYSRMGWVHRLDLVEHRKPRLDDGALYPTDTTAITSSRTIYGFDIYDAGEDCDATGC
jgi:hypothetical protein